MLELATGWAKGSGTDAETEFFLLFGWIPADETLATDFLSFNIVTSEIYGDKTEVVNVNQFIDDAGTYGFQFR